MVYCFSLGGIEYAREKSKKVRVNLIIVITLAFSLFCAWTVGINEKKIPIDNVEKAWESYTEFCREQHISWSELTFPEWLSTQTPGW